MTDLNKRSWLKLAAMTAVSAETATALGGGGKKDGLLQSVAKSQARSIANKAAGQLLRGVLGSLLGGKK